MMTDAENRMPRGLIYKFIDPRGPLPPLPGAPEPRNATDAATGYIGRTRNITGWLTGYSWDSGTAGPRAA
jgi:hypothetical protein